MRVRTDVDTQTALSRPNDVVFGMLFVALSVLAGVVVGLLDDTVPIAVAIVFFFISSIVAGVVLSTAEYRYRLLAAFIVALLLRFVLAFVFHSNHDALVETGLRDDVRYYEAGLFTADLIRERGLTVLLDIRELIGSTNLTSWFFYYFNSFHFLFSDSLLLPVLTLAMINALSGLLLFNLATLLSENARIARLAFLLWMFSPSAIGWSAINHKETLVAASILVSLWVAYSKRNIALRLTLLLVTLIVLAGLRWYIAILVGFVVLGKLVLDNLSLTRFSIGKVLMAFVVLGFIINSVSLMPFIFQSDILTLSEASTVFSETVEQSWERTGSEKAFASAMRARQISPILGWSVSLFAFLFTPPPTRWLGIQEFRVFGALLFDVIFAFSIFGAVFLWKKNRLHYWPLIVLAIFIPALIANTPALVGSRHRFQVEPIFTILAAFGFVKMESLGVKRAVAWLIVVGIILASSGVDLLF